MIVFSYHFHQNLRREQSNVLLIHQLNGLLQIVFMWKQSPCLVVCKINCKLKHNILIQFLKVKTKYAWAFTRGMYNILKILVVFVIAPTYNLTKYPLKLHIKSHKTINAFGVVCFYTSVNFCKVSFLTKTCKSKSTTLNKF